MDIDIFNYVDPFDDVFLTYWVRVFQELEQRSSLDGLTFYIVWHQRLVGELPSYGDDVVAVLLMDEDRIAPDYADKVRFVFRTFGFRPWCAGTLRGQSLASGLKCLRDSVVWASRSVASALRNRAPTKNERRLVIPLGYARQTDLPVKPFETRRWLASFLGSIEHNPHHPLSLQGRVGTPKGIARSRMAQSLGMLPEAMRDSVFCGATTSFNESVSIGGDRYSELMADTRICLAPRGSSVETYRFFEAMRQGCVVICDRQPPHWFYAGCPAIQIDDWRDVADALLALSAAPERLLTLHRQSLAWWETKLSEAAVAGVMADRLARYGPGADAARPDEAREDA